jgi:hypothetical protein
VDAELIDTHVVNELQRYLGDFEAWRDQLQTGYASERQRLEREQGTALSSYEDQEKACERTDRLASVASNDSEAQAALRIAAQAHEELVRRQTHLEAVRAALEEVPDEVPADAMFDFYNELSAAVHGRLDGANTISRVNDALKDIFEAFIISPPSPDSPGTCVTPIARTERTLSEELTRVVTGDEHHKWIKDSRQGELGRIVDPTAEITPPLRKIQAPSAQLANAQL